MSLNSTNGKIHTKNWYCWVIKIRNMGLGQYNSPGEYCDPHTASSVFLILLLMSKYMPTDIRGTPSLSAAETSNGNELTLRITLPEKAWLYDLGSQTDCKVNI